jgi:hypothetical protein
VVAAALGVALAAVAVAAAILLTSGTAGTPAAPVGAADAELRRSALDAARAATVSITSYDHSKLDEDFGRVRAVAVGDFAKEYEESTAKLRPALEQSQAVATAAVPGAGGRGAVDRPGPRGRHRAGRPGPSPRPAPSRAPSSTGCG